MRFLCDHMLIRLGRWLRAAGYDTAIAGGDEADAEILAQSQRENRLLVTRDRHFLDRGENIFLLHSNAVDGCALELGKCADVNWLMAPFTRCLDCNTVLEEATEEATAALPDDVGTAVLWCPQCQKALWHGSHTERMLRTLQEWADANGRSG